LVTGHRGLLGSACVRHFSKEHKVVTYNGDLTYAPMFYEFMRSARPEAIIHCAAKVGGVKSNRDRPVDFLLANTKMQNVVMQAAHEFYIEKLVFIATSCLYPKNALLPVSEESLLTGPFEPDVQAYAVAKLAGYELCKAYNRQFSRNFMTVAPCNLYGINDNYGPSAHVIPALINKVYEANKTKSPVVVWGDGSAIREFLFADDCADAIDHVFKFWNKPDIINIGSGCGTNIRTLIETIKKVSGLNVEVKWDSSQPTGIYRKTFNTNKIQSLGWGPLHNLEEGLKKTWDDFIHTTNPRFS